MIDDLKQPHKTFFYLASALLGVQFVYLIAIISAADSSACLSWSMIPLAASMPFVAASCAGSILGSLVLAQSMLSTGSAFGWLWLIVVFYSQSLLASVAFILATVIAYRGLYVGYKREKS
ncbi:hypothetical protein C41B8_00180 [Salinisphaera hydrothermalis C41B8]|uniref:Uncharacterized protein n=1 Tax=Salinisphaera hydrothermalis (strain C41B8) TaxID=1304275 RepID=A0A084IQY5_SALHC|nr:hypothetical protein C41B8_00180 [Salinisphaera hydrothermalis C41B8]